MSETWVDAVETDAFEDTGEGAYDSEDTGEGAYDREDTGEEFGEESRSARRRRERQRQIMLARQRQQQAQMRRPGPPPPSPAQRPVQAAGPSPRQTIRAIRSLDLDTKLELASLRRELKESNRRASRGTWATISGVAAAEIINQFDALENHPNVSAAILGAPLLLLSPERQRSGIEGFLLDPRVIGGAAVVGIAVASRFVSASKAVHSITIVGAPETLTQAGTPITGPLLATAKDRNGNPLTETQFTWSSAPSDLLTVSGPGAQVTYTLAALPTAIPKASAPPVEVVTISAQAGGVTGSAYVAINPSSG